MRRGLVALLCGGVLVLAVSASAAPPKLALRMGQAFRVAGTRVGCWVVGPAASPSITCGLWGRTTRIVPGTLAIRTGDDAVDVYQRQLDGELAVLSELPQPPSPAPPSPPAPKPARRSPATLGAGDVATLAGTDVSCEVVERGTLGVRCSRRDPQTGELVPVSALATVTEASALALRVNQRGEPSTIFYDRQPFIPSAATVTRGLRALSRAERGLARIRRIYHGSLRGYRRARKSFRVIESDLRHDRYIEACLEFTPLLYNGFYLPRRAVLGGAGRRYLASVRRVERALCG
jgi:hypothetical protein